MTKSTTALGGLDYSKCRNEELERFFKERTAQDAPAKSTKSELVKLLRKVDRQPWNYGSYLRFLDLPPEMRNSVYLDLLHVRPRHAQLQAGETKCQPALLGVCKQVQSETENMLYADQQCDIDIDISLLENMNICHSTTVFSKDLYRAASWPASLKDTRPQWPPYLRKFHSFSITTTMCMHPATQSTVSLKTALHHELYRLTSFLMGSKSLKNIKLDVTLRGGYGQRVGTSDVLGLVDAFLPLARLGREVPIIIVGVTMEVWKAFRVEWAKKEDTSKNVLADFFQAQAKLKDLQQLQHKVEIGDTESSAAIDDEVTNMINAIDIQSYVTKKDEGSLERATNEAEKFMAGGILEELNNAVVQKVEKIKSEAKEKISNVREANELVSQKVREINKEAKKEILEIEALQKKLNIG